MIECSNSKNCMVCLENFCLGDESNNSIGICCGNEHFICASDFNSYLINNVFTEMFKLRSNKCGIKCPLPECDSGYNCLFAFSWIMGSLEQRRYLSIINDLFENDINFKSIKHALIDQMTLKCPHCKTSVDPLPDACSAILCLNCGHYYCNYCFKGFCCENRDFERTSSHEHVATHNMLEEFKDAFLSPELIVEGQRLFRLNCLIKYVAILLKSFQFSSRSQIELALVSCRQDLTDLNLDTIEIWNSAIQSVNESNREITEWNSLNLESCDGIPSNSNSSFESKIEVILLNAIISSNKNAALQILSSEKEEIDVDYIDQQSGMSLAMCAVASRQLDVLQALLTKGANLSLRNSLGRTLIFQIIEFGFLDVLIHVFSLYPNFDINTPITSEVTQYFPIHVAVINKHKMIVKLLLERGALVNVVDNQQGYSPLISAILVGEEHLAIDLLMAGSSLYLMTRALRSALFVIAEKGCLALLHFVLANRDIDIDEIVEVHEGINMLYVACIYNQLSFAVALIQLGAKLNLSDARGENTPLLVCIKRNFSLLALELIKGGADCGVDALLRHQSPLYCAIERGMSDVVRELIMKGGIDVNADLFPGTELAEKLLHISVRIGQSHLIPLFLELGAHIDVESSVGDRNALTIAVCENNSWVVSKLLQLGSNPKYISSKLNRTPLLLAIEKGFHNVVHVLVSQSKGEIDINELHEIEDRCETPLHYAIRCNSLNAVFVLMSLGSNPYTPDNCGIIAFDLAQSLSRNECLHILQSS